MTITCIHGNGLVQLISDDHKTDCAGKLRKILPPILSSGNRTISKIQNIDGAINGLSDLAPPCVNCDDIVAYVMCAPIPQAEPVPEPKKDEEKRKRKLYNRKFRKRGIFHFSYRENDQTLSDTGFPRAGALT